MSADLERYTAIADWINEGNLRALDCTSVLQDEVMLEVHDVVQDESRFEIESEKLPREVRAKVTKLVISLLGVEERPYTLTFGSETASGVDYLARIRAEAYIRFSNRPPQVIELLMESGDALPLCMFEVFQGTELADVPVFRLAYARSGAVTLMPIHEE